MTVARDAAGAGPPESPARDLDAARLAAWRAVRDAGDTVLERISADLERSSGLPLDWYGVLLHLYRSDDGRLPQHELERQSRLSQSGVSRMLSRMQQAGLVDRSPSQRDRRNLDVVLTDHGRDIFLRATPGHHAAVQAHFGAWLDDNETATIIRGLRKVVNADDEGRHGVETELDQLLAFGDSVLDLRSDAVVVGDAVRTRDALEPALLQDAAKYITRDGVDQLRAIVARMSCLIDAPEAFFTADWDLHRTLAAHCHNDILRTVYLALLDILSSHVSSVVPTANLKPYLYQRLAIHARIVDAVAGGDPDQVAAAAHAHHFTDVRSRLINRPD